MSQAPSQAKIPEGAKSFTIESTGQGSNDRELLHPKYTGCKAECQRVQWDLQRVQLHPLHWPDHCSVQFSSVYCWIIPPSDLLFVQLQCTHAHIYT